MAETSSTSAAAPAMAGSDAVAAAAPSTEMGVVSTSASATAPAPMTELDKQIALVDAAFAKAAAKVAEAAPAATQQQAATSAAISASAEPETAKDKLAKANLSLLPGDTGNTSILRGICPGCHQPLTKMEMCSACRSGVYFMCCPNCYTEVGYKCTTRGKCPSPNCGRTIVCGGCTTRGPCPPELLHTLRKPAAASGETKDKAEGESKTTTAAAAAAEEPSQEEDEYEHTAVVEGEEEVAMPGDAPSLAASVECLLDIVRPMEENYVLKPTFCVTGDLQKCEQELHARHAKQHKGGAAAAAAAVVEEEKGGTNAAPVPSGGGAAAAATVMVEPESWYYGMKPTAQTASGMALVQLERPLKFPLVDRLSVGPVVRREVLHTFHLGTMMAGILRAIQPPIQPGLWQTIPWEKIRSQLGLEDMSRDDPYHVVFTGMEITRYSSNAPLPLSLQMYTRKPGTKEQKWWSTAADHGPYADMGAVASRRLRLWQEGRTDEETKLDTSKTVCRMGTVIYPGITPPRGFPETVIDQPLHKCVYEYLNAWGLADADDEFDKGTEIMTMFPEHDVKVRGSVLVPMAAEVKKGELRSPNLLHYFVAHQLPVLLEKALSKTRVREELAELKLLGSSANEGQKEDIVWAQALLGEAPTTGEVASKVPTVVVTERATGRQIPVHLNQARARFLKFVVTRTKPVCMEFDAVVLKKLFKEWLDKVSASRFCANLAEGLTFEFIPAAGGMAQLYVDMSEIKARGGNLMEERPHYFRDITIEMTACYSFRKCTVTAPSSRRSS